MKPEDKLPSAVDPCDHYAKLLGQSSYPTPQIREVARARRDRLRRYAGRISYGSDEVGMVYAMAKVAADPAQRKVFRAFLDELDAIDAAIDAQRAAPGGAVAAAAAAGFKLDE